MKIHLKNVASVAVAGKLAVASCNVSAGGLGKMQSEQDSFGPPLSLDQVGFPPDILLPPQNREASGTIFSGSNAFSDGQRVPRIDFIINHIQNQEHPVVIFLAYSTFEGDPSQWSDLQLNNLYLDRETTQIISAYNVAAVDDADLPDIFPTPLGRINHNGGNSVVVSLDLDGFDHPDFDGDNIYFQAIAIPVINDNLAFADATVSELDHYIISSEVLNRDNIGSKLDGSGLKLDETGSKQDDGTGSKQDDSGSKDDNGSKQDDGTGSPRDDGGKSS